MRKYTLAATLLWLVLCLLTLPPGMMGTLSKFPSMFFGALLPVGLVLYVVFSPRTRKVHAYSVAVGILLGTFVASETLIVSVNRWARTCENVCGRAATEPVAKKREALEQLKGARYYWWGVTRSCAELLTSIER